MDTANQLACVLMRLTQIKSMLQVTSIMIVAAKCTVNARLISGVKSGTFEDNILQYCVE